MGKTIYIGSIRYIYATISSGISAIKNEFLFGGHVAAIDSATMVFCLSLLLDISVCLPLLASAYLLTLIVYSYDYYRDMKTDMDSNAERSRSFAEKVKLYPYILGFYVFSYVFLLGYLGSPGLMALTAGLAAGGLLYSMKVKGITRYVPGFKNLYTSAAWAMGSVLYVVAYYSLSFGTLLMLAFLFILLKVAANTIFYDMKDARADARSGLKTLPIVLGEGKTMLLLRILNAATCLPILAGVWVQAMPPYALSMAAACFYVAAYLHAGRSLGYGRYILADAEILLWPVLLLVGKTVYYGLH